MTKPGLPQEMISSRTAISQEQTAIPIFPRMTSSEKRKKERGPCLVIFWPRSGVFMARNMTRNVRRSANSVTIVLAFSPQRNPPPPLFLMPLSNCQTLIHSGCSLTSRSNDIQQGQVARKCYEGLRNPRKDIMCIYFFPSSLRPSRGHPSVDSSRRKSERWQ